MKMDSNGVHVDEMYFHINNGGVSIGVFSGYSGPELRIHAEHFGHETNNMKLYIAQSSLKALGEMLAKASEYNFKEDYCCALVSEEERNAPLELEGGAPVLKKGIKKKCSDDV